MTTQEENAMSPCSPTRRGIATEEKLPFFGQKTPPLRLRESDVLVIPGVYYRVGRFFYAVQDE